MRGVDCPHCRSPVMHASPCPQLLGRVVRESPNTNVGVRPARNATCPLRRSTVAISQGTQAVAIKSVAMTSHLPSCTINEPAPDEPLHPPGLYYLQCNSSGDCISGQKLHATHTSTDKYRSMPASLACRKPHPSRLPCTKLLQCMPARANTSTIGPELMAAANA